jgi:hypothetical protein
MKKRANGAIQSSNTPTYYNTGISREDHAMYRCMVIDVLYADDDRNISKNSANPEVLYEVVILGGSATGQTLSYCRLASYLDGDNYSERTLKKSSKNISKTKLAECDGDVVYVQFVQGHDAYPAIIGMARGPKQKAAAKKADGPRFTESYNGMETTIDNKGEYKRSMKGGATTEGSFKANDTALITESWTKEKITTTFKSGLNVVMDGEGDKVTITTKAGVATTIDGTGNKISIKAGATEIEIDGASGKISLKGEMIDLGKSTSDFVTMFTELATAFNSHTHIGNLAAPTSPPQAPLLSTVGSQTVKVQP